MPKASPNPPLPLNGLFPIAKPSGPSSMRVIDSITPLLVHSKLFDDPERRRHAQGKIPWKKKKNTTHLGLKIGQGGTLDPLADGVLVIGVNRGTKHLNRFLECTKTYTSIGMLGASTTTYDAEGEILTTAKWDHITREDIEGVLDRFRGEIIQTPPIFSALKMDGKPLYEYARASQPLPRAIPTRKCQVSIELLNFTPASKTTSPPPRPDTEAGPSMPVSEPGVGTDGGHLYRWPTKHLSADEKAVFDKLHQLVHDASAAEHVTEPLVPNLKQEQVAEVLPDGTRPPTFEVRMTVSSGTYVRSIVNDIGLALGCGAHVVKLTRTRQGEFTLYDEVPPAAAVQEGQEAEAGPSSGATTACIPWEIWERAIVNRESKLKQKEADREEALASGASEEEAQNNAAGKDEGGKEQTVESLGQLEEWEQEVLRRFVPVPVPISGSNS